MITWKLQELPRGGNILLQISTVDEDGTVTIRGSILTDMYSH